MTYQLLNIALSVVAPLTAIMLNEIRSRWFKKTVQVITTLPYFIGWVLMYAIVYAMLNTSNGVVNQILVNLGIIDKPLDFLLSKKNVMLTMNLYTLWKNTGWNMIIYLAALSAIDPELYEAAMIDGASRFQRVLHITIPMLLPTYFVLFIMNVAGFLNTGFERFFIFQNPMNQRSIEVLDLYTYTIGIRNGQVSFSTAIGMMKSCIGILLFFISNWMSKKIRGVSIF